MTFYWAQVKLNEDGRLIDTSTNSDLNPNFPSFSSFNEANAYLIEHNIRATIVADELEPSVAEIQEAAFAMAVGANLLPVQRVSKKVDWELEDTIQTTSGTYEFYIGRIHLLLDDEEVGLVAYRVVPRESRGQLVALAVDEEYRSKGYGSLLLDWAIEELKFRGAKTISTNIVGSGIVREMLAKRGFKTSEEDDAIMYLEV